MTDLAKILLVNLLPRAGFCWEKRLGSLRIMRNNERDAEVKSAVASLSGKGPKPKKRDVMPIFVRAINLVTETMRDTEQTVHNDSLLEFVARAYEYSELVLVLEVDIW